MSGLGYGLPLSRVYARFGGGDLQLLSMEGYGKVLAASGNNKPHAEVPGTDAYLHLRRIGNFPEPLFVRNEPVKGREITL